MNRTFRAGILGATGMVGQRFVTLLADHPWFKISCVAASPRSAGSKYGEIMKSRWVMAEEIPENVKNMTVLDASNIDEVKKHVDFVFCAVDMDKAAIKKLEEDYARAGIPVISNNSAHRMTPDVPMMIPEINGEHHKIIAAQRARLGTSRGFIAVKPNCSIQSYVPALEPLRDFGIKRILACTYQAISGAGKTFETMPEIMDNVIPYIGGEEEKSEQEPLKIWGTIENGEIKKAITPNITTQCIRVPVSDGHLAAVFVEFEKKPTIQEMKERWANFKGLELPSSPTPFIQYFEEPNRPQTKLDRMLGNGMGISVGRLREDTQYDYKFVCLSHNTLRGAAGGGVLTAEYLAKFGYFD